MVRGIESFKAWFEGYEEQYTIIGGTACDLLMTQAGLGFRATKDIDLVLIVEALNAEFAAKLWDYVVEAQYEHRNKSTGEPQFYRFSNPKSHDYPMMIELFSRKPEAVVLPKRAILTPLPMEEDISSLSAILLNEDYYTFLKQGRIQISGVSILDVLHLIPFKAKAWIELSDRKSEGEQVDSKNIRKHKNDIFRLAMLLDENQGPISDIPVMIKRDMQVFCERILKEDVDLKSLNIHELTKESVVNQLRNIYG